MITIKSLDWTIYDIQEGIKRNARSYLELGLKTYKELKPKRYQSWDVSGIQFQTVIGNLSISIELMLKAIIAKECFPFLYSSLPRDFLLMYNYPNKISDKSYFFINDLTSFAGNFKTIEFKEATTIFYELYPDQKDNFKPYFEILPQIRNNSIHAFLPNREIFNLDRIVYISLSLFQFLLDKALYTLDPFDDGNEYKRLIERCEMGMVETVAYKIKKAKENSKREPLRKKPLVNCWDKVIVPCIICQSDAYVKGYCDFRPVQIYDEDENDLTFDLYLDFFATGFECEACELNLTDKKELDLTSIDTFYDRSHEVDNWLDHLQAMHFMGMQEGINLT